MIRSFRFKWLLFCLVSLINRRQLPCTHLCVPSFIVEVFMVRRRFSAEIALVDLFFAEKEQITEAFFNVLKMLSSL